MALARRSWEPGSMERQPASRASAWRWPAFVIATLSLLTVPPILVAALATPSASVFSGYVVIARDAFVYQAMWRDGWQGAWLFHPAFTSEAMPGILLYPWYLWPAHLTGWAGGPWLYHLARLAAAAALLGVVWLLVAELFRPRPLRRWAFVLCVLGGGVGALLPRDVHLGPWTTHATEMASPGTSVADLISMAPHLPWALALMCWTMVVALRLRRRTKWWLPASGVLAVIGLQLIYPQLALLAVASIGSWSLVRRHGKSFWFATVSALVQLPYLGYLLWVWRTSPAALGVIRPALDVGDPFGFLVLSHLVATVLIVVALWRRRLRGDLLLPALWIAGMTVFMFTPGIRGTLGRSFMASSVPFGLCATPGLLVLVRLVRPRHWRRRALLLTLAASSLFGLFSLAQPYWIAAFWLDPYAEYESVDEAALLHRLAPHVSRRDIVLTTYLDGLFVPAQTDARVFGGHPDMTIDAPRKSTEALAFFTSWSPAERAEFLRANDIDYVLTTSALFRDRLGDDAPLRLLDSQGSAALYEVVR
ncbi:MAG: hypothetical protein E6J16_10105 [Chloroflexota bacterium]|nr:MAG: hypothetical protein E6J16_10105 [Chloroflexota bacterium]